jgi:hypothetical protein
MATRVRSTGDSRWAFTHHDSTPIAEVTLERGRYTVVPALGGSFDSGDLDGITAFMRLTHRRARLRVE